MRRGPPATAVSGWASRSDLPDLPVLFGEGLVDALDVAVGQLLHLVRPVLHLVLADLVLLFERPDLVHAIPADAPDGDAGPLGVTAGGLGEFGPAFGGELRDGDADELAVG